MMYPRPFITRSIYLYGVIIVCLFVVGLFWFIWNAIITPVRAGMLSQMTNYQNVTGYNQFVLADQFMSNFWTFFLAIMMIALLYYAIMYTQRKGRQVWIE